MELAGAQTTHLVAVKLGERGEHHGVDGYVDADAERIGAADDGQQTLLRQTLDQQAIARQHASMVHADAASEQALENLAKGRGEARALGGFLNGLALLLAGDAKIGEGLRRRKGGILAKVHDIERGLAAAHGELDRALEGGRHIVVAQRNGTRGVDNQVASSAGVLLERGGDGSDIAERGAHEHELCVGQGEQRHLPGPTAIGVGKVVEFVHGDAANIGIFALAQCVVGKDLGRAADDGRLGVDMRVACDHTDVIAAEHLYQIEELFADQGLDRGRVITALALCHAHKEHAQRDERFTRSGRRAQNDVISGGQVHESLFLVIPQLNAAIARPFKEALKGLIGREPWFGLAAVLGLPPGGGERAERAELGFGSRAARE